jgi:hypothetical protein
MIQETGTNQHSSLYIYTDQSSYEPLARIDKRGNDPERVMYSCKYPKLSTRFK